MKTRYLTEEVIGQTHIHMVFTAIGPELYGCKVYQRDSIGEDQLKDSFIIPVCYGCTPHGQGMHESSDG